MRPEVERALQYIGEHLDEALTLADVARAAHLSEFHFHRVFHAVVGEPVGRYVTRRRLELAALRLAYETDRSVTDIALSSGYSSASNFTKAFTAHFGCSPSRVREPDRPASVAKLTAQHGRDFRPADLYVAPPELGAEERRARAAEWDRVARYVTSPGLELACLASPHGYDLDAVNATWADLIRYGLQLGICGDEVDAWGIAHDSPQITAPEQCRYHACVPYSGEVAAPFFRGRLREGRYVVFHYDGPVDGVERAYRTIYSCWFPESAVAPADFTPIDHYVSDGPRDGRIALEMWLRIRRAAR